jgi:hypothetical protein
MMVEDKEEEDDKWQDDTFVIPTTNAGKTRVLFNISRLARKGRLIPNHGVLNHSGSLLHRRNVSLKTNLPQRHFLQSLVVRTHKALSVPLIYPEGTIFFSQFWMSKPDGLILGALPSCSLLDDNQTVNNLGFASIYDQSQSRLLDPLMLLFTNHIYQSFVWDELVNLGRKNFYFSGCFQK